MNKRAFNKVINSCQNKKKTGIDIAKVNVLDDGTKIDVILYLVKARGPILTNFVPNGWLLLPSFFSSGNNNSWLASCGYLHITHGKKTKLSFIHTAEQTII